MICVGIDVSKDKSTVAIMKIGGEVLAAPYDVIHTRESLNLLADRILELGDNVRVVMEVTGHYYLPVSTILVEKGFFVSVVNALIVKKFCSQDLRGAKTDEIDSLNIAEYGLVNWNKLTSVTPVDEDYAQLRMLSRQYHQMTLMAVKARVNLSNLLDKVMPGVTALFPKSKGKNKLENFVERYCHFEKILKMGKQRFVSDYCNWAKKQGYRMNERKANAVFALAQDGIPVIPNTAVTKLVVLETVRVLLETEKSRKAILSQMTVIVKTLPEYEVVRAMNGVGDVLAPRLIAEIGDIRRFENRNSLIAYAGIDVPPYKSGKFIATERHITKRGNKYLRHAGYEVMDSLNKNRTKHADDPVCDFILKKKSEGKKHKKALIAGLNKFLRIYFARVSEVYEKI